MSASETRPTQALLVAALVVVQLAVYLASWEPVCVAPDAVGLCAQARHVAEAGVTPFEPVSPAQFVGAHWIEVTPNGYQGRFPPGYPAALALARKGVGSSAALLLTPLLAGLVTVLAFFTARCLAGGTAGVAAALLVATLPLANRLALHGDAHPPAAAVVLLGTWLLARWDRSPSVRGAFGAGLVWGVLPAVRYSEACVSMVAGAFLLWRCWRARSHRLALIAAAGIGLAIPAGLLAAHGQLAFGAPWRTGYSFTNEQTAFAWATALRNVPFYLRHLASPSGAPLLVGLAAAGVGWMLLRGPRRIGAFLASAVVVSAALYATYYWGGREEDALALRFFLPSLSLAAVAAGCVAGAATPRTRAWVWGAIGAQCVLGLGYSTVAVREESAALRAARAVDGAALAAVPSGSVIIAPRALDEVLNWRGEWHLVPQWLLPGDPERSSLLLPWEVPEELERQLRDAAGPSQVVRGKALRAGYAGLRGGELLEAVLGDVARWQPGEAVYWIGDPRLVGEANNLLAGRRFEPVGRVVLPEVAAAGYWIPRGPLGVFRLESVPPPDAP